MPRNSGVNLLVGTVVLLFMWEVEWCHGGIVGNRELLKSLNADERSLN